MNDLIDNITDLNSLKKLLNDNEKYKISIDNYIENQKYVNIEELKLSNESLIKIKDYTLGQTRTLSFNKNEKSKLKFINKILPKKIEDFFKSPEEKTTDDLRNLIEKEASKYNLTPIENCYSYTTDKEKWFALNYIKKYDIDGYLVGDENFCFCIEKDDIWNINVELINDTDVYKIISEGSDFYEITNIYTTLKLDCSKHFYNSIKNKLYIKKPVNVKERLGFKECLDKELIKNIPLRKINNNFKVYVFRDNFKIN